MKDEAQEEEEEEESDLVVFPNRLEIEVLDPISEPEYRQFFESFRVTDQVS